MSDPALLLKTVKIEENNQKFLLITNLPSMLTFTILLVFVLLGHHHDPFLQ